MLKTFFASIIVVDVATAPSPLEIGLVVRRPAEGFVDIGNGSGRRNELAESLELPPVRLLEVRLPTDLPPVKARSRRWQRHGLFLENICDIDF